MSDHFRFRPMLPLAVFLVALNATPARGEKVPFMFDIDMGHGGNLVLKGEYDTRTETIEAEGIWHWKGVPILRGKHHITPAERHGDYIWYHDEGEFRSGVGNVRIGLYEAHLMVDTRSKSLGATARIGVVTSFEIEILGRTVSRERVAWTPYVTTGHYDPPPRPVMINHIDAAYWDEQKSKVYFFTGNQYVRWVPGQGVDEGYPRIIGQDGFRGLWPDGVDAAYWDGKKEKVYFFKGNEYIRWTPGGDAPDPEFPKKIGQDGFKGLWSEGVDAAYWDPLREKVYFFRGNQYIRWTPGEGRDSDPKTIGQDGFKGLWSNGVDAAYWDANKQKVYFFKGNEYIRWTPGGGAPDAGYPKSIEGHFKGIIAD